jgi:hypothetical protein
MLAERDEIMGKRCNATRALSTDVAEAEILTNTLTTPVLNYATSDRGQQVFDRLGRNGDAFVKVINGSVKYQTTTKEEIELVAKVSPLLRELAQRLKSKPAHQDWATAYLTATSNSLSIPESALKLAPPSGKLKRTKSRPHGFIDPNAPHKELFRSALQFFRTAKQSVVTTVGMLAAASIKRHQLQKGRTPLVPTDEYTDAQEYTIMTADNHDEADDESVYCSDDGSIVSSVASMGSDDWDEELTQLEAEKGERVENRYPMSTQSTQEVQVDELCESLSRSANIAAAKLFDQGLITELPPAAIVCVQQQGNTKPFIHTENISKSHAIILSKLFSACVLRDGCPLPQKKAVEIKERKYEVRINTKQLFKKTTQVVVTDTVNV